MRGQGLLLEQDRGLPIDSRMKSSLAVSALRNAIMLRDPQGTIVHSDRGSQFRRKRVVRL